MFSDPFIFLENRLSSSIPPSYVPYTVKRGRRRFRHEPVYALSQKWRLWSTSSSCSMGWRSIALFKILLSLSCDIPNDDWYACPSNSVLVGVRRNTLVLTVPLGLAANDSQSHDTWTLVELGTLEVFLFQHLEYVKISSIGNHAYCSCLRYANPLHCLVPTPRHVAPWLCHCSMISQYLVWTPVRTHLNTTSFLTCFAP